MMSTLFRSLVAGGTNMVRAVPRASVVTTSVAASSLAASRSAAVVNHATAARAGAPSVANVVKRNFSTDAPAPFSVVEQLADVTDKIRHLEEKLASLTNGSREAAVLERRLKKLEKDKSVLVKAAVELELEEKKKEAALAQKALVEAQAQAAMAAATPTLSEAAKALVRAANDAAATDDVTFGFALVELTKQVCADVTSPVPCKSDKAWGVTGEFDARLTAFQFTDFKTESRKKTELAAIKYVSEPSKPREGFLTNFGIAATIAAPGTGKTRLLDDLLRATLPTTHYDNFFLLPITFNGTTPGDLKHPLAVRALFQFVCGYVSEAKEALRVLDHALHAVYLLRRGDFDGFDLAVLNAIEAVYFHLHGGTLGRSVLLIDELASATFVPSRENNEKSMYRFVVDWIDDGAKDEKKNAVFGDSRRGAVFTGASVLAPALGESDTTRPVVALPLGTFDVYKDPAVRRVLQAQAGAPISPMVWALLAATSGRPRDILDVFAKLKRKKMDPSAKEGKSLFSILTDVPTTTSVFERYLLPSLLGVVFKSFTSGGRPMPTQFGRDAESLSLANADAAGDKNFAGVPAVSLRFVETMSLHGGKLPGIVHCLVETMVFDMLDRSGKDFERAWVLLTMCVLQLQFLVRRMRQFWPEPDFSGVALGGPRRPTAKVINVFAQSVEEEQRTEALFTFPRREHVFEATGSTIHREIALDSEPTLAVWRNAWARTVKQGPENTDKALFKWPKMKRDVEWRSSTIVYFDQTNVAAVDFMLLVGDAGGTGAREPHVYMFQCKAWQSQNVAQADMEAIVAKVDAALETLFSDPFAESNVLRKAGVHERRQVTLCLAAISFGGIDWESLAAPFNVVLFDGADFRAMCGGALVNTTFCQQFPEPVKTQPVKTQPRSNDALAN